MRNRTPNSSHRWYDELKSENTVALLDRLEAEMDKGEIMDLDLIDALLQLLDEKAPLPESLETPEEALQKFKEKYGPLLDAHSAMGERKPRPVGHRILRVAMAACLCVVMLGIVAQASGIDLIGRFLEWHEETFVLHGQGSGQMVLENVPEGEYNSLSEVVAAYEIDGPLVPSWIPETFAVQTIRVKELSYAIDISARYTSDDKKVIQRILLCEDGKEYDVQEEHSDSSAEIYQTNGISFLISSNNAQHRASWLVGHCTCSISGDLTKQEIMKMIDSIFINER